MTPPFEPVPEGTPSAADMLRENRALRELDEAFMNRNNSVQADHFNRHGVSIEEGDIVDKEAIDKAMQNAKAEARAKAKQDAEDLDKMVAEASIPNLAALMQQGLDAGHITRQPVYQTKYPISH